MKPSKPPRVGRPLARTRRPRPPRSRSRSSGQRPLRRRLTLKDEFILATFPTLVVLAVLGLAEAVSRQRVLFASLASSDSDLSRSQHGQFGRSIVGSHRRRR